MSLWMEGKPQPVGSFAKGIDKDSPRTMVPDGHIDDAENMLLYSSSSGQHMSTMKVDALLDSLITWPDGNLYWFAPFTFSTYNSTTGVLAFETHLLMQRSTGQYHTYVSGSPGTTLNVRRLTNAAAQLTTHFIYDQWIVVLNGRDAPYKYGQHFLWDGQGHATPYLFPLGSKPITPLDPSVTGETWTHGAGGSFVADASVPGGGARVGSHSLLVKAGTTSRLTFAAAHDLQSGPKPYGGTNFTTTDFLGLQYLKSANAGGTHTFKVRFYSTYNTVYEQYTITPTADGTWQQSTALLSSGSAVGGFTNWSSAAAITDIEIINDDASNDLYIDDLYLLYANAPPAALVGTAHKDRIVVGGAPVAGTNSDPALSTLFWTDASKPDEFPSTNTQVIAGGAQSLSRTNRISALREYGDAVIIGTQNCIFAWTVGTDGTASRSVITTETGIDSPRAISETPSGSLLFPWQHGMYILRQTGRNYVSQKVAPIFNNVWLDEPWWTLSVKDEKTKTIRIWFRERFDDDESDPTGTTNGLVFDYVRAQDSGAAVWPSRMTQLADYAVEAFVNGQREVLYCKFNSAQVFRLGVDAGGELQSSVTLPWLGTETRDKLTRWTGVNILYSSNTPVSVYVRYANHPQEFDSAVFEEQQGLLDSPVISDPAHIPFGGSAKFVQVKLQAQEYGYELFPPFALIAAPRAQKE